MRDRPVTLRFAVLSAVLVALVAAVLQTVLSRMVQDRARASAESSAEFVTRVGIEPLLGDDDLAGRGLDAGERARLSLAVEAGLREGVLSRVKVFDVDGTLVHSDDPAQVGTRRVGHGVREALAGRTSSELTADDAAHAGERALGQLLEVYVPLLHPSHPTPVGAVELYVPYDAAAAAVAADAARLRLLLLGLLGVLWAGLFRIVQRASRQLRHELARNAHSALHDALTGLPNRTLLFDRIERALASGRRTGAATSVLLLDLDRFKEVNDTLGHSNGDLLLGEVASRLERALREVDTLARLGGDEFAVLLPAADTGQAVTAAHRLVEALEAPVDVAGMAVAIGVSVGIAVAPGHGETAELLLQRADVAMYAAKQAHTRVQVYAAERDPSSPGRLGLFGELRTAIEQDQLLLHLQPKADVRTGRLLGVEALVRWAHPVRGLVPPDEFVPLAEHSGLMRRLTPWVLDAALSTATRLSPELTVAVNVSVRNLVDPAFPDVVAELLAGHGVPASRLVLEITESALMADPETALSVLRRLRAVGVRLSLDDYGSGWSSLAYLQRLPVDELKIDRAFVRDIASGEHDWAIVRSTVQLGRSLGLTVVAEGVEDAAAWQALADLSCDQLQGFHLCRPLPEAELVRWLRAYDPQTHRAPVGGVVPAQVR